MIQTFHLLWVYSDLETIKPSHGSDQMWVFPYHGAHTLAHTLADHNDSRGSSELYQHGPNKRPSKSAQRPTSFKDPPYLCPTPLYDREFRLSSETAHIMRLINLHAVLIALVVSAQVAASFIPTEERGTSFSCEIFLRSSFLPNYLRSQPAIAAESGSEEGFLPDVN
jgi:hypothetical protein